MKLTFKHKMTKMAAGILAVVFGLFILNNVVFLHAHKLSNGQIIVHAHPYNKCSDSAPLKSHPHTTAEFYHLSHIQLLFFVPFIFFTVQLISGHKINYHNKTTTLIFKHDFGTRGREPPVPFALITKSKLTLPYPDKRA